MIGQPPINRVSADDLMSLVSTGGMLPLVGAVLILGGTAALEPAGLVATIEGRLSTVPRLRQCLEQLPLGEGRPIWVDDPDFRLSDHLSVQRCPSPGGQGEVLGMAATLLTTPLPPNRALWAAILVTDVGEDQAALIMVLHHVLADGAAGLTILAGLMDGEPEPFNLAFPQPRPIRARLMADAARDTLRVVRALPAELAGLAKTLTQFAPALRTRLAPSSLNRPTGPRRRIAMVSGDLAQIHAAAHRHGATVNDVLLGAITGALRRLLAGRGESADSIVISVPISFRRGASDQKLGNQNAVVPVRLPTRGKPGERLRAVARLTGAAKLMPPGASNALLRPAFRLLSRLGLYQHFIDHQRLIHTFVTNVRGPAQSLSLGGCPVLALIPLASAGGNITVSFAALSYAGRLTMTLLADPETCPDLDDLRGYLTAELEALTSPHPDASAQPTLS